MEKLEFELFKRLLKDDMINFNAILIKNANKLKLETQDVFVLSALQRSEMRGDMSFMTSKLLNKVSLTNKELYDSLERLTNKGFVEIKVERNKETLKENEVFSLDKLYSDICSLYLEGAKEEKETRELSFQEEIVNFYEANYKKQMSPLDADCIRNWVTDRLFSLDEIKKEMLDCLKMGKTSLRAVDQALIKRRIMKEQNPEYDEANSVIEGLKDKWKK